MDQPDDPSSDRYRTFRPVPPAERPTLHRDAVRVLLVGHSSAGQQLLLFEDTDPGVPGISWWMTPGGGIDPGESERAAAVRELAEETGLVTEASRLVGPVARREVVHGYSDQVITQTESFWLLEVDRFEVDVAGHTEEEQLTIQRHHWWSLPELAQTREWIWPGELLALLRAGRAGGDLLDLGRPEESTVPAETPGGFDAVVLAGGTARRLGGVSKPDVVLHGRRLLDHTLDAVTGASATTVVGPAELALPEGVRRSREDPPLGGPVAGLAAGLAELRRGREPAPLTAVLGCDAPYLRTAVPRLLAALTEDSDGAVLVDAEGRPQWLTSIHRTQPLADLLAAVEPSGASLRETLGRLQLARVPARGWEAVDVDTPADLTALEG